MTRQEDTIVTKELVLKVGKLKDRIIADRDRQIAEIEADRDREIAGIVADGAKWINDFEVKN